MTSTKQMKKYSVKMNFTKVYDALKPYKLREYTPIPVILNHSMKKGYTSNFKITAKNPDDACFLSMKNLIVLLREQEVPEGIIEDVKNLASVKSIEELDE